MILHGSSEMAVGWKIGVTLKRSNWSRIPLDCLKKTPKFHPKNTTLDAYRYSKLSSAADNTGDVGERADGGKKVAVDWFYNIV